MVTTSMPLTSVYSRQNISDDANIYIHKETKSTNGNIKYILNINYSLEVIKNK